MKKKLTFKSTKIVESRDTDTLCEKDELDIFLSNNIENGNVYVQIANCNYLLYVMREANIYIHYRIVEQSQCIDNGTVCTTVVIVIFDEKGSFEPMIRTTKLNQHINKFKIVNFYMKSKSLLSQKVVYCSCSRGFYIYLKIY